MGINSFRISLNSPDNNFHHSSTENIVKIGRSLKCDFNVPREELSREHCQLEMIGNEIFITDLASKNGVTVDNVRIKPNKKIKVNQAAVIILSNIYTLKLNTLEIKTKADMVIQKPTAPDIETLSFQLDLPKEKNEKVRSFGKRVTRTSRTVATETNNYDSIKMIMGFLAVVAAILYQALGR